MFRRQAVQPKGNLPICTLLVLIFLTAVLNLQPAQAAQVTLAWDPNTDPAVMGYKLYWGTQSQTYALLADVGNTTTQTVADLQPGTTYSFAATAYDAAKAESAYSNEVSYTAPVCTYSLTPSSATLTEAGGTGTLTVSTQSTCPWTASSAAPWLTITSGATGTGSGTVGYSVAANATSSSRMAGSTIAGQTFNVTQAGVQAYTITASAGTGGTITPSGAMSLSAGANQSFTITPNAGYSIGGVTVDGASVGAVTTYAFSNVSADHAISATFASNTYTLSVTTSGTGGGTVTTNPNGTTFALGTSVTLTAAPNANSTFTGWSGACLETSPTCTVAMNSNVTATASFQASAFSIAASSNKGGSVSPQGTAAVPSGGSKTYNITPASGYSISDVKVDGCSVGKTTSYTFTGITANHSIQATFVRTPSTTSNGKKK
jgi:uncharacterized repeat protein (TIGR02543 family)